MGFWGPLNDPFHGLSGKLLISVWLGAQDAIRAIPLPRRRCTTDLSFLDQTSTLGDEKVCVRMAYSRHVVTTDCQTETYKETP